MFPIETLIDQPLLLGSTRAKRRRVGGRFRRDASASSKEAASGHRGTSASKSCSVSLHRAARPYLGQFRVAAGSRSGPVLGEFCHQHGRCAYARPSQQERAREAARGYEEVSSGEHRSRYSFAADAELRSTGKRELWRALHDLIKPQTIALKSVLCED